MSTWKDTDVKVVRAKARRFWQCFLLTPDIRGY
jgi:hypothetical protein